MGNAANRSARAQEARRQNRRSRRLSHLTAVYKLSRFVSYPVGATIPAMERNVRVQEIAFRMRLMLYPQPGVGAVPVAEGLLFAVGGTNIGTAAWITQDKRFGFGAGNKPATLPFTNLTWTHHQTDIDFVPGMRRNIVDLAFSVRPGDGSIRAWWNGQMVINAQANAGTFNTNPLVPAVWGGQNPGAYFALPAQIPRVALVTTAPNVSLQAVSPLSVYLNSRPWHFDTGPRDPNVGPIPYP